MVQNYYWLPPREQKDYMIFFDNALNLIKSEGKDQPINPKFMSKVAAMTNEALRNEDWFSFNSNFEEDN